MAKYECRQAVEVVLIALNKAETTAINFEELMEVIHPLKEFDAKMHSKCVSVLEYLEERGEDYLIDATTEFEEVYDSLL